MHLRSLPEELSQMRIILYTGKGGVGKTSVAAATALRAAGLGRRTLVMSTDAAHSLGDSFDMPLGGEPLPIAQNLWGQELDVFREIDRHWGTLQDWLKVLMAWRGLDEVVAEEMAVLPGMEELAGLLHLVSHHKGGDYEVIVVDCAPTGETLRLLSFPDVARWWMHRIFPIERVAARIARPVLRRVTDLPLPDDEVFDAVKELFAKLEEMRGILTDPALSSVRLVLNPEKMVIKETQRTFTYLNLYGYATDLVVCNRVIPGSVSDSYFQTWKVTQARHYHQVEEAFAPLPILKAPLMEQEVVGMAMLERFGEALYGTQDPTAVLYKGQIHDIRHEDGQYVLTLAVPFVSREEISLSQVGDELVVQAGAFKRNIILPRAMAGMESQGAKLEGERLSIRFARPR
jgi:arsenite-transporting ATPase